MPITSLRVSGCGSQSDAAMQLTADIVGLPTARPHIYEPSGLGAAINAAVGLGLHPDFDTAIGAMTRIGRVFEPQPQHQAIYDALYSQVYKKTRRCIRALCRFIGGFMTLPGIRRFHDGLAPLPYPPR